MMKLSLKKLAVVAVVLGLAGCSSMDYRSSSSTMSTSLTSTTVTEVPAKKLVVQNSCEGVENCVQPSAVLISMILKEMIQESSLYFGFNSVRLNEAGKAKLNELIPQIKMAKKADLIKVHGYADSTGPADYNKTLSKRRALAVRDYLVSQDLSPDTINVIAFGEEDPRGDNSTKAGRAENRRVDVKVKLFE